MAQTLAEMQAEMKSRATGGKCPHGIWKPAGDPVAYYCSLCWPSGPDAAFRATPVEAPKKPRKKTKASTETVQTSELGQAV